MKVSNTPENNVKCVCDGCPTYDDCMEEKKQKLFCASGKTECQLNKQGCICGECPISSEFQLNDWYFCEKGVAK